MQAVLWWTDGEQDTLDVEAKFAELVVIEEWVVDEIALLVLERY
jgi:hypothetical protein